MYSSHYSYNKYLKKFTKQQLCLLKIENIQGYFNHKNITPFVWHSENLIEIVYLSCYCRITENKLMQRFY